MGQNWWLKVIDRWPIGAISLVPIDPKLVLIRYWKTSGLLSATMFVYYIPVQNIAPMTHATCLVNFDRRCGLLYVTMPTFFFIRWEIPSIWTLEGGNSKFDRWENPPGVFKL